MGRQRVQDSYLTEGAWLTRKLGVVFQTSYLDNKTANTIVCSHGDEMSCHHSMCSNVTHCGGEEGRKGGREGERKGGRRKRGREGERKRGREGGKEKGSVVEGGGKQGRRE